MGNSRTAKSIKNAYVAIIFYFFQMILGFWSRKVFYEYLGSEVLGLDTAAATMLNFLNLAELGVSASVGYFLYKPMYDNDIESIKEIVSLQGWIYRRIAFVIIIASIVLMSFFPVIFKNITIPLWYAYATFSTLMFGSLLGYFMNYKMCVLYADQKEYRTTSVTQTASIIFKVLLIIMLPIVKYPFLFYIGTTMCGILFGTLWLRRVLKREYPWLKSSEISGKSLMRKYPDLFKKTKQIFIHRISTVVVLEIQPIILYAFSSLTVVAYLGNYNAIIVKAKSILKTAFSSTQAGIGNLVASNDFSRIKKVFWELFDSRLCFSSASIIILGLIANPFIKVWLSPDYILQNSVLILLLIQNWIAIVRTTVDNYITAYGLFQDTWAPIVESVLYLGGSIIFGFLWGISGVLMGGLLSNIVIICTWKPIFLFNSGFKENPIIYYFIPLFKRLLLIFANIIILIPINNYFHPLTKINNFLDIFIYACILGFVIMPIFYVEFYFFCKGMRSFNSRMVGILKDKLRIYA